MSTEIEIGFAQGGHFVEEETERILDAIDRAKESGEEAYFVENGQRVARIVPLAAGETPAPDLGPAAPFVSRVTYANGTRQEVWAVCLTAANYQRIIGWLQGHAENADWSDAPSPLLNFGGRRGSYSIPPGWWVVLYPPETTPARAGVEGWDPDDFNATWIAKADQDQLDRQELAAQVSLYRASLRH